MNYVSEVWGFSIANSIKRIHMQYCKSILQYCFIPHIFVEFSISTYLENFNVFRFCQAVADPRVSSHRLQIESRR